MTRPVGWSGTPRGPGVAALIATERERSPDYGGRSVFGWELHRTIGAIPG